MQSWVSRRQSAKRYFMQLCAAQREYTRNETLALIAGKSRLQASEPSGTLAGTRICLGSAFGRQSQLLMVAVHGAALPLWLALEVCDPAWPKADQFSDTRRKAMTMRFAPLCGVKLAVLITLGVGQG